MLYCVIARSNKPKQVGTTVEITKGGPGHAYITIEVECPNLGSYDYYISLYGK